MIEVKTDENEETLNYEVIKRNADSDWNLGLDKFDAERKDEHRLRMSKIYKQVGIKDEKKTVVVTPSKASIIAMKGGIPILEGECHREAFFSRIGVKETNPIPIGIKRKFIAGRAIETVEHEIEKRTDKFVAANKIVFYRINKNTVIVGEIDGIMKDNNGRHYVKEIKTVYGYTAVRNHITGNSKVVPKPRITAALQIMLYIAITGLQYGILKFIDGTAMIKEHSYVIELKDVISSGKIVDKMLVIDGMEYNDITMSAIISRMIRIGNYIREVKVPPRDCSPIYQDDVVEKLYSFNEISKSAHDAHMSGKKKTGSWQCAYCKFRDLCTMQDNVIQDAVNKAIMGGMLNAKTK